MKIFSFSDKKLIYISLCLGCITISFNVAAITAAIPTISADLGLSDLLVSRIIPYYLIPYGLGALIYAPLTKYISYRKVLSVSMFLYSAACVLCGVSHSIWHLLFFRVIMGLTAASAIPMGLILIGELFDKNIRGRLIGGFFGSSLFASLAGVALSGVANWRWIFFVPAIIGMITALSFFIMGRSENINKVHGINVNYLLLFTNIRIRNVFLFISVMSALYYGVNQWYGVYYSKVYGFNKLTISFYFIISAVASFMGQIMGGYLSDKKGRLFACYMGLAGLSLGIMALALRCNYLFLGIVISLISMSWTIGHNGFSTMLTDFPDEHRPLISSLNSSVRFISGGIGFNVSSYFVSKSFSMTFFTIGILIFFMILPLNKVISKIYK